MSVYKIVTVTGDLKKQDVILAGKGRLTLWQDKTDTVSEGVCYAFNNMVVRQYKEKEYLCMGKSGSSIEDRGHWRRSSI